MLNKTVHRRKNEEGVALVTTLLFLVVMGLLSTTLIFTVQNEIQTSTAYKYKQQAFYVADAGIQKALQWYRNSYTPHVPSADYDITECPVEYSNDPVLLAGQAGYASAYPETDCITAFTTAFNNKSLQANSNNTGLYAVNATLLKHTPTTFIDITTFTHYNSARERWRLSSVGYWGNANNPMGVSRIEAIIENSGNALFDRGLWGIEALTDGGDVTVDSFNPALGMWDETTNNNNGGSIGSNGVITSNGNITVGGDVGYGPNGSYTVNGGSSNVSGGVYQLPEEKYFPPVPPFNVGSGTVNLNNATVTLNGGSAIDFCTLLGDYRVGANSLLVLNPGAYCFNSLQTIATGQIMAMGTVQLYVKSDFNLGGGGIISPPASNPADVKIFYSGTNQANLLGSSSAMIEMYAPNAPLKLNGGPDYHGSFIGRTLDLGGGVHVHFNEDDESNDLVQRPFRIISWTQKAN